MKYQVEIVYGHSPVDHLAPIVDSRTEYTTLRLAREALENGRRSQGNCESKSRQVRCDILRSDGWRFRWE